MKFVKSNMFLVVMFLGATIHLQALRGPFNNPFVCGTFTEKTNPNYVIHTTVGQLILLESLSKWAFEVPKGKNVRLFTKESFTTKNNTVGTGAVYKAVAPGREFIVWKPIITTPWYKDFFHILNPAYWYFEHNCRTWEIVVHDIAEKLPKETPYAKCNLFTTSGKPLDI